MARDRLLLVVAVRSSLAFRGWSEAVCSLWNVEGMVSAESRTPSVPLVSRKVKALANAAERPKHGEDTWEEKLAWDRANEADAALDKLLRVALPDFVALLEAAEIHARANPPKHDPPCGLGSCSFHSVLAALDERLW